MEIKSEVSTFATHCSTNEVMVYAFQEHFEKLRKALAALEQILLNYLIF